MIFFSIANSSKMSCFQIVIVYHINFCQSKKRLLVIEKSQNGCCCKLKEGLYKIIWLQYQVLVYVAIKTLEAKNKKNEAMH
jgi:hypothetical protein